MVTAVMEIPESLLACLADRYGIRVAAAEPVVGHGDEASVWRVQDVGRSLVVRVSPGTRELSRLVESNELATALADTVVEVTAPIRSIDGSAAVLWGDRPISVWPFVDGAFLDRFDPEQLRAAARLARLHRVGRDWLRTSGALTDDQDQQGLVHGDFYARNLLCHRGRIAGLIDWDDARIERLDAELAWATWEMAKSPRGDALAHDRAALFLNSYVAAAGPGRPQADFIQLIRARLIGELGGDDPDYEASLHAALRTVVDDDRHRELVRTVAQESKCD